MLSLVAGGAIDEYILSQLRALRQEHQLARLIHSLQITLWPGGIWFQRLPGRQPPVILPTNLALNFQISLNTLHGRSPSIFPLEIFTLLDTLHREHNFSHRLDIEFMGHLEIEEGGTR